MNFKLISVDNLEKLEILRKIRNDCKNFMTNHTEYIDEDQQIQWFKSLDYETVRPYLFFNNEDYIGYGIIKISDNLGIVTGGLITEYRNRGIGKFLFADLTQEVIRLGLEPTLDVLKSNLRAIKLYSNLGYNIIDENDKIYMMKMEL